MTMFEITKQATFDAAHHFPNEPEGSIYRRVHGHSFTVEATVQSAIAFTSMARGNVPAAVCSASASSLVGIVVTPLLCGLLHPRSQMPAVLRWARLPVRRRPPRSASRA